MNRKPYCLFIAIIMCTAFLIGCAVPQAEQTPMDDAFSYTFTDALGEQVTLTKRPQTVAVLFSSFADIFVTAGGTVDISVGESVKRGFADENAVLVDSGTGHSSIDLEALVAAKPDLVIGTADYDAQSDAVKFCREQGITAAALRVESFADYIHVLEIFCNIIGNIENYQTYGVDLQTRIDDIISAAQYADSEHKRILFIRSGSSASSAKAKTAQEHFAALMLDELGTTNIAQGAQMLLDTLSIEVILKEDPDYIFVAAMGDETAAKEYISGLFESAGWSSLTAVKNGDYTFLPKDLFQYKPNSRWAEAYQYLYDILYSE